MMANFQVSVHEQNLPKVPAHFLHSPIAHGVSQLPQIISHRGYKGKFPENTMCAIERAVEAGTQALELDIHLTRDGVVVLSHDASLQRCFGVKKKIIECDWEYVKTLRTLQAPHEPMPRLVDALEYLRQPGREQIWVLLDIKLSNDPATIIQRIAESIEKVPIPAIGPDWHRRIVLGCWSAAYLPQRARYLPRYALTLICVNLCYARQFLQVPRISFTVNQMVLMSPLGRGFLEEARAARRQVYLWTVNAPNLMRWGIRHHVDGVITDDPALFQQVSRDWEEEQPKGSLASSDSALDRITWSQRFYMLAVTMYVSVFGWFIHRRYLSAVEPVQFEERKVG